MNSNRTSFPSRIFITGTDTGIGKTLISAILVKGLNACYWKPIQSGLEEETDTEWIQRNTDLPHNHFLAEQYRLTQPLSPHLSARIDGVQIRLDDFEIPDTEGDHLIIEGAGGIMVPINKEQYVSDLIRFFDVPVIVVARSTLGTINHTLLTLEKLRDLDVPILGVVLNGKQNHENRKAIETYGNASVIAEIEELETFSPEILLSLFESKFKI